MKQLMHSKAHQRALRPVASPGRRPFSRGIVRRRHVAVRAAIAVTGVAKRVFKEQADSIEGDPTKFLQITEAYWKTLKASTISPPKSAKQVVKTVEGSIGKELHVDACICGGTLGIFVALALQRRGWRTCIVEKRQVAGRTQEWNISRGEVQALVDLELVTREELEDAIVTEFNPIRVGFNGGEDLWVNDVLNLGVSPKRMLAAMRRRYEEAGGVILEGTAFLGADVHSDGVRMQVKRGASAGPLELGDTNRPNAVDSAVYRAGQGPAAAAAPAPASPPNVPESARAQHAFVTQAANSGELRTRLLVDCMGHYSDIVKQMRVGTAPHGMCLVVGGCAEGFAPDANTSGDLLYTFTDAENDMQLFWEAFPAEGGRSRTTYMFTYTDAHPSRPCFEAMLDRYFELLPQYQGVPLEDLKFKRVLFGGFPCYNNGPLQAGWDRVVQVGDASASASPLSFGGFGSMVRHIPRLTAALSEALASERLSRADLALVQPYQPSLSAAWLFQRSMSMRAGQLAPDDDVPAPQAAAANRQSPTSNIVPVPTLPAGLTPRPTSSSSSSASSTASSSFHMTLPESTSTSGRHPATYPAFPPTSALPQQPYLGPDSSSLSTAPASGWLPKEHINRLLACNFGVMAVLGDRCLRPFLQDSIVLGPLSLTMTGMMLADPVTILRVFGQVGPSSLLSWFGHYAMLATYRLLFLGLRPLRSVVQDYYFQRFLDALQYGSGSDYTYHAPDQEVQQLRLPVQADLQERMRGRAAGGPLRGSETEEEIEWGLEPLHHLHTMHGVHGSLDEIDGGMLQPVPVEAGVWERRWREGKLRAQRERR